MYQRHFGLKDKPFEPTSDPKYIWLSRENEKGLEKLKQAFIENLGYLVLSGDTGVGKNALMSCFLNTIENKSHAAIVWDPDVAPIEFFNLLSLGYNINRIFGNKTEFLRHFKSLVENTSLNRLKLLIVIDESQGLKPDLAQELDQLMNIDINGEKLVNTLLLIQGKELQNFSEIDLSIDYNKVIGHHHVEPLSQEDTHQLIRHRLKAAGTVNEIYTTDAVHEIFRFSAGYPRLINLICDRTLLTGYVSSATTIDAQIVLKCANELQMFKI